jgi:hypothetical protein
MNSNEYMREYFKKNPLKNAWNKHNLRRRKRGLKNISLEEFRNFKKFIGVDIYGRSKTNGRASTYLLWDKVKDYYLDFNEVGMKAINSKSDLILAKSRFNKLSKLNYHNKQIALEYRLLRILINAYEESVHVYQNK